MGEIYFFDSSRVLFLKMNDQLYCKVRIGRKGEIRRISIPAPQSFVQFKSLIIDALDLSSRPHFTDADIRFKYEDEEKDLISIYTDADLAEALRQVELAGDHLLRLTVGAFKEKSAPEEKKKGGCPAAAACHPFAQHGGFGGIHQMLSTLGVSLPEMLANPNIRSMAEGLVNSNAGLVKVVTNYICDHCDKEIVGDRYKSTTQDNFDLCASCSHSEAGVQLDKIHKFQKVSAFESLMACLNNGGTFDAAFETETKPEPSKQHAASCDICSEMIVGDRFKCLDCLDYDECQSCRAVSKHEHEFYQITDVNVRQIPSDVLAAHRAKKEAEKAAQEAAEKKAQELEKASRKVPAPVHRVATPVPSAPVEAREPSAFEKNLQVLEGMGFTDRKRNISVLVRNRNKLFESIQELLA